MKLTAIGRHSWDRCSARQSGRGANQMSAARSKVGAMRRPPVGVQGTTLVSNAEEASSCGALSRMMHSAVTATPANPHSIRGLIGCRGRCGQSQLRRHSTDGVNRPKTASRSCGQRIPRHSIRHDALCATSHQRVHLRTHRRGRRDLHGRSAETSSHVSRDADVELPVRLG